MLRVARSVVEEADRERLNKRLSPFIFSPFIFPRTVTNTWDADSNRVGLTINGDDYSFVYDKTAGIPAVLLEDDGETEVYYFREPSGALVARLQGTDWRYYHFDELGSTRLLTDGQGNVTDRYVYDAWGSLGYYTHYQDPEFKLLQLVVRFYDCEIGRFTQRDPIQSGATSGFVYANDRVLVAADPDGRFWHLVIGGAFLIYEASCLKSAFEVGDSYRGADNVLHHESHYIAHCMAACLGTRCLPRCGTALVQEGQGLNTLIAGGLMELFQTTPWGKPGGGGWGNAFWKQNMSWNVDGVTIGLHDGACFSGCYANAKKKGLL